MTDDVFAKIAGVLIIIAFLSLVFLQSFQAIKYVQENIKCRNEGYDSAVDHNLLLRKPADGYIMCRKQDNESMYEKYDYSIIER